VLALGVSALAPAASGFWPFGGPRFPDPRKDPGGAAAVLLSRAIRFNTVNPPGNEAPLARFLVDVARHEGLQARVIETPSEGAPLGRAAAWVRLRGTGARLPVVLLSHLDVVPADGEGWIVDPFQGLVAGGYVVGRGALDAKGVAIVHLLALVELAHRKTPLDRDVILLATPDEETGGREGAGWLSRHHPELLHGAEFLLTEGGGILVGDPGGLDVWGVAVSEKAPCWTRLTARGTTGHASTAGGHGAVPRLVAALDRVRRMPTEVRVTPEVGRMFERLAPVADPAERGDYADLAAALRDDSDFRRRFLADGALAALVRDTVTITVLRAGSHTNVVPDLATADLDVRLLPGEHCDGFLDRLLRTIDDPSIEVTPLLAFESRGSPADTELFRAIQQTAAELDPHALVVPRVIAGFTDAHWFRELGLVAYGFVPRWLPPSETRGIHGPNERISVENLARGIHATVRLLEILGTPAAPGPPRAAGSAP
jgi:acetylornithine deacetylase/succinyl-diaminopimelate desuccinylase-like protein